MSIEIRSVARFLKDEEGASALEYGMLLGLIATVVAGTIGLLGGTISGVYNTVLSLLAGALH